MNSLLEIRDCSKVYKTGSQKIRALDNISLKVRRGEFIAIMGPSGSGKSTLMNLIGCLDRVTTGSYTLAGENILDLPDHQLARIRNRKIGFIFQAFNLLPKLTALRNVEVPLIYKGVEKEKRLRTSQEALKEVGLANRTNHRPSELSGGQQQRVAIARAMAAQPDIILADEPTGNLDSRSSREIMGLFTSLIKRGVTLILVTHDKEIAGLAERNIGMLDGKIVQDTFS